MIGTLCPQVICGPAWAAASSPVWRSCRRGLRRRFVRAGRQPEGHVRQPDRRTDRRDRPRGPLATHRRRAGRVRDPLPAALVDEVAAVPASRSPSRLRPIRPDARQGRQARDDTGRTDARRLVGPRQRAVGSRPEGRSRPTRRRRSSDRQGHRRPRRLRGRRHDPCRSHRRPGELHDRRAGRARQLRRLRRCHDRRVGPSVGRRPGSTTEDTVDTIDIKLAEGADIAPFRRRSTRCSRTAPRSSPASSSPTRPRTRSARSCRSSGPDC